MDSKANRTAHPPPSPADEHSGTAQEVASRGAQSRASASRGVHGKVFDLLTQRLPGGHVLDIPCGSGAFTRRLTDGGFRAAAGDIEAHPAVPEGQFRSVDMDGPFPFDDGEFDAVVSIEGIEHIRRPWDFIRECRRVARPGGILLITTPNISSLRSRWRWFLTGFHNKCKYPLDEGHPAPRHHINMTSYPELRYMLHTSGFRIEIVATNRIKPANWLYLPAVPLQWLVTAWAFPAGVRGEEHGEVIRAVRGDMLRVPVLFGESLILVARAE